MTRPLFAAVARSARRREHLLELKQRSLATNASSTSSSAEQKPQTFIEKIVQRYAVDLRPAQTVKAGDYVSIRPNVVMTHDNTGPCISKFRSIGATRIRNASQVVFALDHDVQNKSAKNLEKYSKIESFAREQGVDFYPAGRGIGHQVMVEEGYAFPHTLAVASDSHSNMYGGVGCLGTPVVRTDAAAIWATGQTWWQIPEQVKVELVGALPPGVTGKDVIVALCGYFNQDQVLNAAIEFGGSGLGSLSVDERLAIANMTTEWGALAGVFPVDNTTLNWYEVLVRKMDKLHFHMGSSPLRSASHLRLNMERLEHLSRDPLRADADAAYSKVLRFDLSTLVPHVSGPNSVKVSTPLTTLAARNIAIHKAYLVSCVNSRASDLKAAADVIRGKKVAPGVEFYVAAASSIVQREAEDAGDWGALMAAGARPLPAGCGPCIGLGIGLLEDGQVGISATNRNYKGRMGSPNAQAYLASPAVVAASAIEGKICGPTDLDPALLPAPDALQFSISYPGRTASELGSGPDPTSVASAAVTATSEPEEDLLLGDFPRVFAGPLIFAPQDNLNTDALYPGKYTYQDDITPSKQAEVVMENYDPGFAAVVARLREEQGGAVAATPAQADAGTRRGVVLVGGYNFGTGSSREQAATALKHAGIPLVLAGSFGDIFKRNAINNGLVCLECPELVEDLTREYAKDGQRGNGGKRPGEVSVLLRDSDVSVSSVDGRVRLHMQEDGVPTERTYVTRPAGVGRSVQEIFVAGGLEAWVKQRL
ncbi:putative LYS4-homoaconitase precursor [Tilletiaria anomala UBC 951]|uniref:Homoaconitase, mitochondrial n=1 Tax=Tilletiaria anomala (strain ATCC 24038 / CBS 436.72 / UBC 951) TaxID=1037660 RepID=A0A066VCJ6_TILAU|nr:putative LYS4-homoaconitase precursor [Tilletiaria anomala UBC 951]KDN39457.1 putative LYS4-homoaconitase precursor [Tilletiaria anomala UBC 951]